MQQPHILSSQALTLYVDGAPRTIHRDDTRWERALEFLRAGEFVSLTAMMQPAQAVQKMLDNGVGAATGIELRGGAMYLDGQLLGDEDYTVKQILDFQATGLPTEPLVAFYTRLLKSPSFRVRRDLLKFLEVGQLPITEDGCFMAYKRVNADFTDCHTGTLDYTPGNTVSMPRSAVDDDPNNTCSTGLHVCSYGYLKHFGGAKVISVKIDPADVVSIPTDYDNTKMRVCSLTSVEEIAAPQEHNIWGGPMVNGFGMQLNADDRRYRVDEETGDYDDEEPEIEAFEPKYGRGLEVTILNSGYHTGTRGVIAEIDYDDSYHPYRVAIIGDANDGETWFQEDEIEPLAAPQQELELVEQPTTKFKVGDRVRLDWAQWNVIGTVTFVGLNPTMYTVAIDGYAASQTFTEDQLDAAE